MIKDIYQWLETAGQKPSDSNVGLSFKLIEEELTELKQAWSQGDRVEFIDAVVDLYWVVTNAAFFAGESIEELNKYIDKVSVSNWSKFCKSEVEAINTVQAYSNGTHPDKPGQKIECYWEKTGQFWIVKRSDGKILKSIKYFKVSEL